MKKSKISGGGEAENSKKTKHYSGNEVHLPPEILLKIFRMVVAEEGALPFLNRYSKSPKISDT